MQSQIMLWFWTLPLSLILLTSVFWNPLEGMRTPLPQPKDPFRSVDDRIIRTPLQPLVDTATHIIWDPNMLVTSHYGLVKLKSILKQWSITVPGVAMLPFMGHHFKNKRDLTNRVDKQQITSSWIEDKDQALDRLTEQFAKYHYLY